MRITTVILFVNAVALLAGCSEYKLVTADEPGSFRRFEGNAPYVVQPPDRIWLTTPGVAELHHQVRTVDESGNVTLPLLGTLHVAGHTPAQVLEMIESQIEPQRRDGFHIEVTACSQFYYIFGPEVPYPGAYAWTGGNNVITSAVEADPRHYTWPEAIVISRPPRGDARRGERIVVDFDRMWETGDLGQNYAIEEGDIIEIPGPVGLDMTMASRWLVVPTVRGDRWSVRPGPPRAMRREDVPMRRAAAATRPASAPTR